MKINLLSSLAGIVLALIACYVADGQTVKNYVQHSEVAHLFTNPPSTDENYNLNGRAVRDFARTYKNVSGESWTSSPNGYAVTFTLHDIGYTIFYDQAGYRLYTMRNFHEAKFPAEIRHIVKRTYYDYDITLVQEISNDLGESAYVIHLEGKTQWVTARVANGQVDEFERFNKSE